MHIDTMHRRLTEARVGRLATITPDNRPHLVPCCFALSDDDTIYSAVDAKPKSTLALRRLDNLRTNPAASLLVDHYADDWSTLWWIRADGQGRIVEAEDEHRAAIALLVGKYEQYRNTPPPGPVIAIEITAWRSWP